MHSTLRFLLTSLACLVLVATPVDLSAQKGSSPTNESAKPEASATKTVARQIIGYWALDTEALIADAVRSMKANCSLDEATIDERKKQMKQQLESVCMQFTKDKMIAVTPRGPDEMSYTVKSNDGETGALLIAVKNQDGRVKDGAVSVSGDRLKIQEKGQSGRDHETVQFIRITKAEFEKRMETAKPREDRGGDKE